MIFRILPPQHIQSAITLPPSKSIANRCAILDFLSGHTESALQDGLPEDVQVMHQALLDIKEGAKVISCGQAGTVMRFLTALLSVTPGTRLLTGGSRIKERPIGALVDALRRLGACIEYVHQEGYPPLSISGGNLNGGFTEIPGDISSQFISALMMAGVTMPQGLTIHITTPIHSRPYLQMTLKLMQEYGFQAEWSDERTLRIPHNGHLERPCHRAEADWSAAAYWYEVVALSKNPDAQVVLEGLNLESLQGDSRTADLFKELGVETRIIPKGLLIRKHKESLPDRFVKDLSGNPDLAQTLTATCCALGIPFRLSGLSSLTIKETDRAEAMRAECQKLGYILSWDGDAISWNGECQKAESDPVIQTYGDHRMVLSMAPLAIEFPGLMIKDPQVAAKSYPGFFDDLTNAGFQIQNI